MLLRQRTLVSVISVHHSKHQIKNAHHKTQIFLRSRIRLILVARRNLDHNNGTTRLNKTLIHSTHLPAPINILQLTATQTDIPRHRTKSMPCPVCILIWRTRGYGTLAFGEHFLGVGDTSVETFFEPVHVLWWSWWVVGQADIIVAAGVAGAGVAFLEGPSCGRGASVLMGGSLVRGGEFAVVV